MNVTVHVLVDTDLASLAKVLTLTDLNDRPRPTQIRAAASAVLARHGLHGALRRYDRQLRAITHPDDAHDHQTRLAWCTTLARQAFPPPKPRRRTPRPAPVGRPLIDVLDAD